MTVKLNLKQNPAIHSNDSNYSKFDQLNGLHPWMDAVPEGFVGYRARKLNKGKISYFNFPLAKEMGLIDTHHPHELNKKLEHKLLETFNLQIINEHDELNKKRIDPHSIKQNKFMATRYLQLQHKNKKGKTSGDGRGIWNGVFIHEGKVWDISSRGTGVTCLAPGSVEAKKPLKTGNHDFGYGCGLAELDELLAAAILAEAIHLQGIQTERVLCIIDLGKGVGIGVRAGKNLIRPAHIFLYLKQDRFEELKKATDYFIERQVINNDWKISLKSPNRYKKMAQLIADSFAKFSAQLEVEYIFTWLDWDGDNVLANAGIIDYGSVRQFGTRHDKYRYDDVERFSTNLTEQKEKAKSLVKVFLQLSDYLTTGSKKSISHFNSHSLMKQFDETFIYERNNRILYRMGLNSQQRKFILKKHSSLVNTFFKFYSKLEKAKISGPIVKVADGINHPPKFNMRNAFSKLSLYYIKCPFSWNEIWMPEEKLFQSILTDFATKKDSYFTEECKYTIKHFQIAYKQILDKVTSNGHFKSTLRKISERAQMINTTDARITGNALIEIVNEVMKHINKGMTSEEIQRFIDTILISYLRLPESNRGAHHTTYLKPGLINPAFYNKTKEIIYQFAEDI